MSEIQVSDGKDLITYRSPDYYLDCNRKTGLIRLSRNDSKYFIFWDYNEEQVLRMCQFMDLMYPGLHEFGVEAYGVNGFMEIG